MTQNKSSTRVQLYWNTLLRIPMQILAFAISIIIARILMPKDFGIMAIVMMLIGYSNLLTSFGLGDAVVQKNIKDKTTLNTIFTFNLTVSVILVVIFYLSAGYIAEIFNTPECEAVVKVMSLVFVFTAFTMLPMAQLRRDMNFKAVSLFDMARATLMSFSTLILAIYGFGYWSLVYGQLIALAVVTVALAVKVKWLPKLCYNHESMKNVFDFGKWTFIRAQLIFLSQHVDRFIVGKWLGATNLGFYDKAITLSRTPYEAITTNINSVMYSSFSQVKNDKETLQKQYKKSMLIISYVNFPLYAGLFFVAPYFVWTLLGEKWSSMIEPFQLVILGYLFISNTGLQISFNVGIGKYKEISILMFVSIVAFIFGCILLLDYNIAGIAASFLIFSSIQYILFKNLSLKNIGMSWIEIMRIMLPAILPTILMSIVLSVTTNTIFTEYTVINMCLLTVIGVIMFSIYVLMDRTVQAKELKKQIWSDIRLKINAK